jgi:hypothetical protein
MSQNGAPAANASGDTTRLCTEICAETIGLDIRCLPMPTSASTEGWVALPAEFEPAVPGLEVLKLIRTCPVVNPSLREVGARAHRGRIS